LNDAPTGFLPFAVFIERFLPVVLLIAVFFFVAITSAFHLGLS
jgi:hypothetical protein